MVYIAPPHTFKVKNLHTKDTHLNVLLKHFIYRVKLLTASLETFSYVCEENLAFR